MGKQFFNFISNPKEDEKKIIKWDGIENNLSA